MTDHNVDHPTMGRRRRYKSPSSLPSMVALPLPRLADHLDTEIGPSDEEVGKEAKRQKSEPTTPISTSSRHPNEYDEVMGITQVDPEVAERLEEGIDSEYHDVAEEPTNQDSPGLRHVADFSHGGCGSSSLRECLNLLDYNKRNSPAPCHSGVTDEKNSDPQQGHPCPKSVAELWDRLSGPQSLSSGNLGEMEHWCFQQWKKANPEIMAQSSHSLHSLHMISHHSHLLDHHPMLQSRSSSKSRSSQMTGREIGMIKVGRVGVVIMVMAVRAIGPERWWYERERAKRRRMSTEELIKEMQGHDVGLLSRHLNQMLKQHGMPVEAASAAASSKARGLYRHGVSPKLLRG